MFSNFYFAFIIAFGFGFIILIPFYEVFNAFSGALMAGLVYGLFCAIFHRSPFNPLIRD